jgi:hypothetical protein
VRHQAAAVVFAQVEDRDRGIGHRGHPGGCAGSRSGPRARHIRSKKSVNLAACFRMFSPARRTSTAASGLRPDYHADYYGAYFRDPDGNKLCGVCHEEI